MRPVEVVSLEDLSLPTEPPAAEREGEGCSETKCEKPDITERLREGRHGQGLFQLRGESVRKFALMPLNSHFSVQNSSSCNQEWKKETDVAVVQWPHPIYPESKSTIEIFVNPLTELDLQLAGYDAWLCAHHQALVPACLCKLHGLEEQMHSNVLQVQRSTLSSLAQHFDKLSKISDFPWIGTVLSAAENYTSSVSRRSAEYQLSLERRCPWYWIPDAFFALLACLVLVVAALATEALIGARRQVPLEAEEEGDPSELRGQDETDHQTEGELRAGGSGQREEGGGEEGTERGADKSSAVAPIITHPLQKTTQRGLWFTFSFVSAVVAWQYVVVHFTKICAPEEFVWATIIFTSCLGLMGVWRCIHVLCRQQLMQALLANRVGISKSSSKAWVDGILGLAVGVHGLILAAFGAGNEESWVDFALWLMRATSCLLGLVLGLFRILGTVREEDGKLEILHMRTEELETLHSPILFTTTPMEAVVEVCRRGRDPTKREDLDAGGGGGKGSFTILIDHSWHRSAVHRLTGSTAGFTTLPCLALAGAVLIAAGAFHLARFSCSGAQLTTLELASTRHQFEFKPWQDRFSVRVHTSFKETVMLVGADSVMTRNMTITKPGREEPVPVKRERLGNVFMHTHLVSTGIPREASINVTGATAWRGAAVYKVRFAPFQIVPTIVSIDGAEQLRRCIAWGSLHGVVTSVPSSITTLNISVVVTEFVFALPNVSSSIAEAREAWVVFERRADGTKKACMNHCLADPNCFTSFHAGSNESIGCYFAQHDHALQEKQCFESRTWQEQRLTSVTNKLVGRLCGCANATDSQECCQEQELQVGAAPVFHFVDFSPAWSGNGRAVITLQLGLAVDNQNALSDVRELHLSRRTPVPVDALTRLHAGGKWKTDRGADVGVQEDGNIEVRLPPWPWDLVKDPPDQNVTLFVALILPDPAFAVYFPPPFHRHQEPAFGSFDCSRNPILLGRYKVCSDRGTWPAELASVSFSPWDGCEKTQFEVRVRKDFHAHVGSLTRKKLSISCQFNDGNPAIFAAKKYGCKILNDTEIKNSAWKHIAGSADALLSLLNDPDCARSQERELCAVLPRGKDGGSDKWRSKERKKLKAKARSAGICKGRLERMVSSLSLPVVRGRGRGSEADRN